MADLEGAFSDFIDLEEYDEAEDALFSLVRKAFKAGWLASGRENAKDKEALDFDSPPLTMPQEVKLEEPV